MQRLSKHLFQRCIYFKLWHFINRACDSDPLDILHDLWKSCWIRSELYHTMNICRVCGKRWDISLRAPAHSELGADGWISSPSPSNTDAHLARALFLRVSLLMVCPLQKVSQFMKCIKGQATAFEKEKHLKQQGFT